MCDKGCESIPNFECDCSCEDANLSVVSGSETIENVDRITVTGGTVTDNGDGNITLNVSNVSYSAEIYSFTSSGSLSMVSNTIYKVNVGANTAILSLPLSKSDGDMIRFKVTISEGGSAQVAFLGGDTSLFDDGSNFINLFDSEEYSFYYDSSSDRWIVFKRLKI